MNDTRTPEQLAHATTGGWQVTVCVVAVCVLIAVCFWAYQKYGRE